MLRLKQALFVASVSVVVSLCIFWTAPGESQEPPPYRPDSPAQSEQPQIPKGVEIMARGPVHEAFATPMTEPKQTPGIPKKPPLPIDEMPPEEKPSGDVVWIGGYWSWDDDRTDFLWVSGCWRVKPSAKEWVPGYWREVGTVWQWVSGFWTDAHENTTQGVTYYPEPPAPPQVAPAGAPPAADTFYIPGYWSWNGDRYVWRAGYWTRVRAGYVYVPSHYQWTPSGWALVPGYWDITVARRGVIYSPIVVDPAVVGVTYVYSPYYAVRETVVMDTLFVRPAFGFYYFGDYYGPRYVGIGFESGVVYSQRYYEPLIVYERWDRRDNPGWFNAQLTLVVNRGEGRAPVPPRFLDVRNPAAMRGVMGPTREILAARGEKAVALNAAARAQVRETARAVHQARAEERARQDAHAATQGKIQAPRTSALNVHPTTASGQHVTPSAAPKTSAETKSPAVGAQTDKKTTTPPATAKDKKTTTKDAPKKTP